MDPGGRGERLLEDPYRVGTDLTLIRRAIKNGWNVPEEDKTRVMTEVVRLCLYSDDERIRINAAKTLVAADAADLKLQLAKENPAPDSKPPVVMVNIGVVQEAMKSPEYLEYLESRALAEDRNASIVREACGPVHDGPAPDPHLASSGTGE